MKKQTDSRFYEYEKQANFIRDNSDLNIAFKGNEIYMTGKSPEALAIRANERMFTESVRQESNIEDVLKLTENELKSEEDVSDEPVDEDWLCRFFGIAKDVNSYEMKLIWAKILSGEIKQPGSFSLRTMETLRNISQKEAELFQKILPFALHINEKDVYQFCLIALFINKIQKIHKIRHNSPDFFGNIELFKKEQKMNIENLRNMALHS